jgi:aspartyl-tRNA(Asn)/glutamyl-tRNA(Gln) amidotransferase subunit A
VSPWPRMTPLGAADTARAVAAGALHPREAVAQSLAAIAARPELNAVLTVCADEALARAEEDLTGRLAGVPVLIKDLIDTAGIRTTYASRIHADHVPTRSAPAVQALEAQGAIVVGKTNADEFAWGVTGQNAHWGDVQNPRLPGRITGGSSSGSAAALAAGLVPLALGTDTGGSVRMPAACCGVVGLKPRVGAPPAGVFPLCPSFDTVGPMARSVADCALAHAVLHGGAVPEPRIAGLRAGLLAAPPRLGPQDVPGERDARAPALAAALEELGAHVQEVELPLPGADPWPLFYAEAGASHRATFPARRDEFGPTIRAKLDDAQRVDPGTVDAARAALAAWREHAAAEPPVDVVVSPTLGLDEVPPLEVDELEIRFAMSAYTRPFSFLGWPAIAIGNVQLAARNEATLLGAALAWERAYGLTSPAER